MNVSEAPLAISVVMDVRLEVKSALKLEVIVMEAPSNAPRVQRCYCVEDVV